MLIFEGKAAKPSHTSLILGAGPPRHLQLTLPSVKSRKVESLPVMANWSLATPGWWRGRNDCWTLHGSNGPSPPYDRAYLYRLLAIIAEPGIASH